MHNFTPWAGLLGGVMIGLASALLLLLSGRVAGVSGFLEAALSPADKGFATALAFLVGLPIGTLLVTRLLPGDAAPVAITAPTPIIILAGLLVGFGTRMANGCTSGHGVCGLPRFSGRSWVAVATFMAVAALTVFLVRHVWPGAL